jgi:hypothetical protein
MKSLDERLNDLPAYVWCEDNDCAERHFLVFSKDIYGKWTLGYVAWATGEGIVGLCAGGADSLEKAVTHMEEMLLVYNSAEPDEPLATNS